MKYDTDTIAKVIEKLEDGQGRVNACKHANINYQTFLNWLADPDKVEFLEAVKKAENAGYDKTKDLAILAIKAKFNTSWQAAAWWLERNYPDQYRNRIENEVNVKEHREILKRMFDDTAEPEP